MLIRERLEEGDFSNSERATVDFILDRKQGIKDMTTKEIARKMGFGGWNELKEAFLKEEEYLQSHFQEIDANLPFQRGDPIMAIAGKIAALRKEAIDDTRSLLSHDALQKATLYMRKASSVGVYAVSNNLILAREFQHNMTRIGKKVELCQLQGETVYKAYMAERTSCALIISYSGETPVLVRGAEILKRHKIPVILITNIGESSLSKMADCVLRICTREIIMRVG